MLDKLVLGMNQSSEDFTASLQILVKAKQAELEKSPFSQSAPNISEADT
jgi:hypothetical protein